jgi:tetratricopeptide (TPR) repeat protein
MKKIILLFLFLNLVISIVAQDYQIRTLKYFASQKIDSLDTIVREIETHNPQNKNRYLTYWDAYARYNKSLLLSYFKKKKEAEKELNKAKELLEDISEKTSEDYALLGMLYNYNISFASFLKIPFLSSKAKKMSEKALKLDKNNLRAYLALGINDFYTPQMYGGQTKCESYFLSCIALDDKTSINNYDPAWGKNEGYYYLICFYLNNNEREKAKTKMSEALTLYPNDARLKSLIKS